MPLFKSICSRIGARIAWVVPLAAGGLLSSSAQATFSQCTTPLPGAGNCTFVTKGVGGCTNEACCRAICGLQEECCTEFWSLDCVVTASSLPECAAVTKCPVTCPVGGLTEAEPCGENTNGGCNSTPPAFPQTLTNGQTVCGTAWIAEVSAGNRDTDWYKVNITTNSRIEWDVQYEGARVTVLIIKDIGVAECGTVAAGELDIVAGTTFLDACNAKAVACVDPGTYYVFVAHGFSPADGSAGPFEVPCTADDKDYRATLSVITGSPLCVVPACSGGASTLTQNVSQTIVAGSVACLIAGPPLHTVDNAWARVFNLGAGATTGQSISIKCVEHAVEANGADSVTNAKMRIHRLTSGTAPAGDGSNLVLLGEANVVIPAGFSQDFVRANFSPAVNPPVNSIIMVEFFYPDTLPEGGGGPGPGGIWPGSNSEGQTGPVFRKSGCSTDLWTEFTTFPNQHNILNVKYDLAGLPCPTDINSNGCTNGADIACILGIWTGAGTYPGCTVGVGPFHPADLNQDCRRNGLDVAIVLGSWGPCPGGACPGPTLPCP